MLILFIYLFIYLLEPVILFWGSLINIFFKKEKHLLKIEMFSNNINLYSHCFYQFNKSMLNKN